MTKTFCDVCGKENNIYRKELLTINASGNPYTKTYELCFDFMKAIAEKTTQYINERMNLD